MKKQTKKLTLQKETLAHLKHVTGGDIISYYNTIPIDDTVYRPVESERCGPVVIQA